MVRPLSSKEHEKNHLSLPSPVLKKSVGMTIITPFPENAAAQRRESKSKRLGSEAALPSTNFRFSGHQSFSLRISWLPKAIAEIAHGRDPLTNIDVGIVSLGLGKNMVEALRCWIDAFQVAKFTPAGWELTPIGALIFGHHGLDRYLEDHATSWLLHWQIATSPAENPFFAWECVFNRWPSPEFSATAVIEAFRREAENSSRGASSATLKQHWEVFLHTYRPPRSNGGEDHLESVLSNLGLIREAGERQNAAGRWETVYQFDLRPKRSIPQQLFSFFLHDWWNRRFPSERTVPVSEIIAGAYSPGRILKMSETEVLQRLSELAGKTRRTYSLTESASLRQLHRREATDGLDDLRAAYKSPHFL